MRKRRIAVELFAMMIAVTGVFHGSMNVNAATKKITVDQTYENATKIKGKTKKGCVVKVKIGKKTYQSKVNKKGNYSVKVSKLKLGKKYTMTAYQKKKVYAKKSFYAETKNIKVNAFTENDHIFSGYAPSKAYIVLKCSGKSYTTTASVSGYWKIDTKKPLGRNRIERKSYCEVLERISERIIRNG